MAATMPLGWSRPLADRLVELKSHNSIAWIAKKASRIEGCQITITQVRHLLGAPPTLNPLVVKGVCAALGMSEAEAARLQREGERG